jgi:glycosyltransferase involved in cell wall biosynthesis
VIRNITAGMVVWNEGHRLQTLLDTLRPVFEHIVIVVQESTDDTLDIALQGRRFTDKVIRDEHRGTGDASMPRLMARIETQWTFIISGDELPSADLLASMQEIVEVAQRNGADGVWIPFRSIVEGVEYNEQHGHLRLFHTSLRWPDTMHSRPTPKHEMEWDRGYILHERSLDEMMQDYLRYWRLGQGNKGWEDHNRLMMHDACAVIAEHKGWDFVKSFPWWPQVEAIAFVE